MHQSADMAIGSVIPANGRNPAGFSMGQMFADYLEFLLYPQQGRLSKED